MPLAHLKRTLEFSTAGTRLSVRYDQLVVDRPNKPLTSIPIAEIGVVILDEQQCSITQPVLAKLSGSGVCILTCDRTHLPVGITLPIKAHSSLVAVQKTQLEATTPAKKNLWREIVRAKIRAQGHVLFEFTDTDSGIGALAKRVLSGDTTNVEAQAARRYWRKLFGIHFRRDRDSDGINALLNYGYAVLRGMVARSLVASGLLSSVGLHHHNRSNAFCLADDIMEPFRPFVDRRIKLIAGGWYGNIKDLTLNNKEVRAALLSLVSDTVRIGSYSRPLSLAVAISSSSLKRSFENKECELIFPSRVVTDTVKIGEPLRVERHERTRKELPNIKKEVY